MKKLLSFFINIISRVIGRKNLERLLIYSAKSINSNLHLHGLVQIGALNGFNQQNNGEQFFIEKILVDLFATKPIPIFFDVGANIGNYTLALNNHFPNANIYSFEPVKSTFDIMAKNTKDYPVKLYNIGFSNTAGTGELFNTISNTNTEIASVYKDVFHDLFKNDGEIGSVKFQMNTIDAFCLSENILNIDFLKIDVEGHELSILNGAVNMLLNNTVKIIQFEFNTHNVYARVFLRDFYSLLKDFEFYRLKHNGMVNLGSYNPANEIFTAQNIIAVHKTVTDFLESKYLLPV